MHHQQVEQFFLYARERYSIFQRRQPGSGWPGKPWTHDPILQQYRFCNVFREDDKVTVWFREKVRNPQRNDPRVVFNTIMFRYLNSIGTGEDLLAAGLFDKFDSATFAYVLKQRKDAGKPMLGAAYMIKTPNGVNKITGLRQILAPFAELGDVLPHHVSQCRSMEELVEWLVQFRYVGRFMAYEIACDLMFTGLFNPTDRYLWANPGPGAKRGLVRLQNMYGMLNDKVVHERLTESNMLQQMRTLLEYSGQVHYWFGHWPRWDMRTVEHTLCEYDKYMRAYHGEGTPKQKFEGV